ncbi:heme-binding protein [Sediminicoccus sp. KRV36]|uniref:SOUL family heme-binding protein n=1 Tax=Sediminicoccus sp. KRV36 TaxID=3133721 RepID=UPI00200DE620|nr:heme-binding protein [Sediminicoccus rosea]UPY38524.1 heme-binding protein [Sediminicoccus rosea]
MLLALAPWLAACSVFGMRSGTEEPPFTIIGQIGEVEIRRYAPRLVAEIEVAGDEASARNAAFRPLAAYIFGENVTGERIGMTAPVAQAGADGAWRIGFFMPARYSLDSLPRPRDPRITIRPLPEADVAVLRFSGLPEPQAVAQAASRLDAALAGSAWMPQGPGGAWFYDPPWTIPGLRRSEAWRPVRRS